MGFKEIFLVVISAGLLILSFPPFDYSWCIWFALVPFLYVITQSQEKEYLSTYVSYSPAFLYGLLLGILFYAGTLYWLYDIFSIISVVLITIISMFIALFGFLLQWLKSRDWLAFTIITASLWTIIEAFKSEGWWLKFSWMNLGYALHNQPIPLLLASLIGQYGLSFLIIASNCLILLFLVHKEVRVKATLTFLTVGVLIYFLSAHMLLPKEPTGESLVVRLVQQETKNTQSYIDLSTIENTKAQHKMIIWPEYAVSRFLLEDTETLEKIKELARKEDATLIIGSKERTTPRESRQDEILERKGFTPQERDEMLHFYNTAYIFSSQGEVIGATYKMNPIPFFMDGYPGEEYRPIRTPWGIAGVLICFDLDFSKVARNLVQKGAQILVVPTYDAYLWGEIQHKQHAAMSSIRAVENARFVVRAASSGVSQIITPAGKIKGEMSTRQPGAIEDIVYRQTHLTFYTRYGYLFPWFCLLLILGFMILQNPHRS
jgi:apolipoprotein N-acyltransferase